MCEQTLKIGICDDNQTFLISCRKKLEDYFEQTNCKGKISVFAAKKELMDYLHEDNPLDILLLDVELGDDSGIEVAKQIEHQGYDCAPEIVFVTNYPDYCSDVYRVNHSFFVVKDQLDKYLPEIMLGYYKRKHKSRKDILLTDVKGKSIRLKLN